ncbi:transmembrane protein 213 [Gastrophryne carolinensis]
MGKSLYICLLLLCCIPLVLSASASNHTVHGLLECPVVSICELASRCCMAGMDSYGWIAATIGWALWFLTLILLCICKVMDLRPDEPKYLPA